MGRLLADDQPRRHHYLFAHRELPAVAFRFGVGFPRLARDGRLDEGLGHTWKRVGELLAPEERLAPNGLHAATGSIDGHEVVVVTLPPAQHLTEAHLAAIVVGQAEPSVRYLVLEHSWTLDDRPATTLAEWTSDWSHINLGPGPDPTTEAFLAKVADHVAR